MKSKIANPDNNYTQGVKQLIEMVYPADFSAPSLFKDARTYFRESPSQQKKLKNSQDTVKAAESAKQMPANYDELRRHEKQLRQRIESDRLNRLEYAISVAKRLIALCEGDTYQETQQLSSKFLGTMLLITRGNVINFARYHQRLKPLYKAVLCLRLIDKAIETQSISDPLLIEYSDIISRFQGNRYWRERWENEIAIPLIITCIMQDIGMQHPKALRILHGEDGSDDEFRLLPNEERMTLLRLNYHHTIDYLKNGLGMRAYIGNDKGERDDFMLTQKHVMHFVLEITREAFTGKGYLGELIKIPQIYTSIIFSTKSDYSRQALPKGYLLIEQLAKKGQLNPKLADGFISIVGYFPQGFGITFIPTNEKGHERDQYEFAIVSHLNPKHPAEPTCRVASRNLTFITSGNDQVVTRATNLFFPANKKKLMRMGKERLIEIMSQLYNNFTPNDLEELIPSFWEPSDYFSVKKNQNLWNRG